MSKHTQEPWVLSEARNAAGVILGGPTREMHTGNAAQGQIASACLQEWMVAGERDANARRIIACVNACAGFATEELEAHTGPRLLHTRLHEAFTRIDALLGERNTTGLAIDAAILNGTVPEQHALRSRLEMLANHRQREQELAAQLKDATRQCGVMADSLRYLREFVTTNVWDDEERSLLLESIDAATASAKSK